MRTTTTLRGRATGVDWRGGGRVRVGAGVGRAEAAPRARRLGASVGGEARQPGVAHAPMEACLSAIIDEASMMAESGGMIRAQRQVSRREPKWTDERAERNGERAF